MLLEGRDMSLLDRVAHVPERRGLVCQERDDHDGKYQRVDLEKQTHQDRDGKLPKHQEVNEGLLRPSIVLNIRGAMAEIIGESSKKPDGHNEIKKQRLGRIVHRPLWVHAQAVCDAAPT